MSCASEYKRLNSRFNYNTNDYAVNNNNNLYNSVIPKDQLKLENELKTIKNESEQLKYTNKLLLKKLSQMEELVAERDQVILELRDELRQFKKTKKVKRGKEEIHKKNNNTNQKEEDGNDNTSIPIK